MPGLADPNFHQAVAYICEHHENGAIGIVINHPIDLTAKALFTHLKLDVSDALDDKAPLFYGGPVQKERGFVLHSSEKNWENTMSVASDICLTGSKDILADIADNNGPEHAIIALGYAGWGAGELEAEIGANHWLTVLADKQIMFETPYAEQWTSAAGKLGIDVNLIANHSGHELQ